MISQTNHVKIFFTVATMIIIRILTSPFRAIAWILRRIDFRSTPDVIDGNWRRRQAEWSKYAPKKGE